MINKEKILRQFRRGYAPLESQEKISSVFKNTFKPLIKIQNLEFFLELCETNETLLRAWGYLGIYHILEEKTLEDIKYKSGFSLSRLYDAIRKLLNDRDEISYFGGSTKVQVSLREHHFRRISCLDKSFTFEPIFEGFNSVKETDTVIVELLENVLTKVADLKIEPVLLYHANNLSKSDFISKVRILHGLENLGINKVLTDKNIISNIFKTYLNDIEEDKTEFEEKDESKKREIKTKKKYLRDNIFRLAAILDLDLESETLAFVEGLTYPYRSLHLIAEKYQTNEKFRGILLKKLQETVNPNFITEILKSILVVKRNIENWKDLVMEYINKYELIDGDLIIEIEKVNLLSESMLTHFLIKGDKWHLEFLKEFLINNPKKLEVWLEFRAQFIKILNFFRKEDVREEGVQNFKEKKEFALRLIIDLERRDMIDLCLENFKNLEDDMLKKLCLFAIINFGNDEVWINLRKLMNRDKNIDDYVKRFWRNLERREWKFYY